MSFLKFIKGDTMDSKHLKGDSRIWMVAMVLLGWSTLVVFSASVKDAYSMKQGNTDYFLIKHLLFCGLAFLIMIVVHKIPYTRFAQVSRIGVLLCIPILIFAAFAGKNVNDASRWIEIPIIGQRFQPSEIAKIVLLTHLSVILARHLKGGWNTQKLLMEPMFMVGAVCGLIFPSNVSTAALLGAVCFMLMYVGKVPIRYLLFTALVLVFVATGAIMLKKTQRSGTAQSRLQTFFNKDTVVYQSQQSYMAMARGGLQGEGIAKSRQRRFLPEPQKDFIFAITVEEYGTIGGAFLMFLYLVLLYRGLRAIEKTKRPFGGLLSAGLTFSIVLQAFSVMGVTVGLLPVTGQSLPFFSQGGTSMLLTGLAFGMILSVSRGEQDEKAI